MTIKEKLDEFGIPYKDEYIDLFLALEKEDMELLDEKIERMVTEK